MKVIRCDECHKDVVGAMLGEGSIGLHLPGGVTNDSPPRQENWDFCGRSCLRVFVMKHCPDRRKEGHDSED